MNAVYFYISLIAFTVGVATATFSSFTYPALIWLLCLSFLCAIFWQRSGASKQLMVWLTVSLVLAFFVLGAGRMSFAINSFGHSQLETRLGEKVELSGVVVEEPERSASSLRLFVKTEGTKIIVTTDRYTDIKYGDKVLISGVIKKPEAFTTDLSREFDYPGYLLARGTEYQISFATVKVESSGKGNLIISTLLKVKHSFLEVINSYLVEPDSGLAAGLLLGVKQGLGDDLEADFRTTGIIHIVVLSGYNIMLIVTFVLYVLGSFLPKKVQLVVGILAVLAFALMVGLSATVVRACIMASLLLVAQATSRNYLVLRALMLAGALMLVINPYLLIYDIGYQLSFMATLGLILLAPILEKYLTRIPNLFGARMFILATISTQIAVLPLILYYMGQLSVLAVLVNVLVLPMVPVAMLLTFFTGLSGFVLPGLATILAVPTYFSLAYIIEIARYFASLPFASILVSNFPIWWLVVAYLGLSIYLWRVYRLLPTDIEVSKIKSTTDDISDWVIEEEFDEPLGKDVLNKAAAQRAAAKEDLPIFFR